MSGRSRLFRWVAVGLLLAAVSVGALVVHRSLSGTATEVRRVVFVTVDTLRADHLRAYGYFQPLPLLDEFSERGVVFLNAYTASSHTSPSHATMFTSLFPFQHQVLENHDVLPAGAEHLAALASLGGLEAVGLPAVGFLEGTVGFPHFPADRDIQAAKFGHKAWFRNAAVQVDRAINWLRNVRQSDRFVLWLHFYDVHQWDRKDNIPRKYLKEMDGRSTQEVSAFIRERHGIPADAFHSEAHLVDAINSYDARVRFVDNGLRRLRQSLSELGLERDTLWVIVADHGEGLGNHHYAGHGQYLYQEQVHVPLIFFMENAPWKARHTAALARTVDILPTLKSLLNLPTVSGEQFWQGRSLLPVLQTGEWPQGHVPLSFAQRRPKDERSPRRDWEEGELFALQDHGSKLIDHTGGPDEFFSVRDDPQELKNRSGEALSEEVLLRRALAAILASPSPALQRHQSESSPESLEELKALGYL